MVHPGPRDSHPLPFFFHLQTSRMEGKGKFIRLTTRGNSRDNLEVNEGEERDKRNRDENVEGAGRRLAGVHVEPVND